MSNIQPKIGDQWTMNATMLQTHKLEKFVYHLVRRFSRRFSREANCARALYDDRLDY